MLECCVGHINAVLGNSKGPFIKERWDLVSLRGGEGG